MEVGPELSRTQKHILRSILLGMPSPMKRSKQSQGGAALPIYRLDDIQDMKEGVRVAAPELEAINKEKWSHLFTDGEEKLSDFNRALEGSGSLQIPQVERVDQEDYERMYGGRKGGEVVVRKDMPFIKTFVWDSSPIRPYCDSDSDDKTVDDDYDMDDEDEEFLQKCRMEHKGSFRVSDILFEYAIAWILSIRERFNASSILEKFESACHQTPRLRSISTEEMRLIASYFVHKSSSSTIPWQPQVELGRRINDVGAYKAFRPCLPRIEPKTTRSCTIRNGDNQSKISPIELYIKCTKLHKYLSGAKEKFRMQLEHVLKTRQKVQKSLSELEKEWDHEKQGNLIFDIPKCLADHSYFVTGPLLQLQNNLQELSKVSNFSFLKTSQQVNQQEQDQQNGNENMELEQRFYLQLS